MAKADEYRQRAAECMTLAQKTKDPADKAKLIEMAESWRRLAVQADEHDKPR